ncbi:MAG: ABC transporter ATP-binding protein [Janthinobacterium lividum]
MSDLSLTNVTVRRAGRIVLDDISARFRTGRLTVVIGPNGAGKSTLLDVAAGLLRPDAGTVLLDGIALDAQGRRALAKRRAYLPQSPQVDWPITVERVVALGLTPQLPAFGPLPAEWLAAIEAALERYDLLALRLRPATRLSGGELARVMLARATVGDPEILIVDEPTAGLDPRHALDAARRLRAIADSGRTVVVALHDLDLALRIADDALAVRAGRLIASGPADQIFTEPGLAALYDVRVRVGRDRDGASVRFLD